jgi:RNA polymerase sigma-70 factor (ECF subfamily)
MTDPTMLAAFDVNACIQQARGGMASAAEALIAHLHPLVRRLVRNHLPRRESEEDLIQEVFIKVFQKLDAYHLRDGIPFEHWVSRLTVRSCLDALRAERSRPEWRVADLSDGEVEWMEFLMNRQTEAPAPPSSDAREIVARLLALLSPADRLVLTLLDLEQRSTLEISEITGWTRPMVKMRAMRARLKLRGAAKRLLNNDFPL